MLSDFPRLADTHLHASKPLPDLPDALLYASRLPQNHRHSLAGFQALQAQLRFPFHATTGFRFCGTPRVECSLLLSKLVPNWSQALAQLLPSSPPALSQLFPSSCPRCCARVARVVRTLSQTLPDSPSFSQTLPDSPRFSGSPRCSQTLPDSPRFCQILLRSPRLS